MMKDKAFKITRIAREAGATRVLYVGGCVRDRLLREWGMIGADPAVSGEEIDIEVYGLSYQRLKDALSRRFSVKTVGASFAVLKVDNEFDVSVPRRENKIGKGHKGFDVEPDPDMTPREAAMRRDFTINAMAIDPGTGELLDFFGGANDLKNRVLRATSEAFSEDPLRVLRGMQFAGRFNLSMEPGTVELCRGIYGGYGELAVERVFGEWWKWAAKSACPGKGLELLAKTGWIGHYPQLESLMNAEQDPEWHPEGDVFLHTVLSVDAAATVAIREGLGEHDRGVVVLAALCHDLGKPPTTTRNDESRVVNPKHAGIGGPLTAEFMRSIGAPNNLIEIVPKLVAEHMTHVFTPEPTHRVVRRLASRLAPASVKLWSYVVEADYSGRHPLPKGQPAGKYMEIARELQVEDSFPKPVLMGRHLLAIGFRPGVTLGDILRRAYEAQLDGEFCDLDGALEWVRKEVVTPV